jgi:hypothetical protein
MSDIVLVVGMLVGGGLLGLGIICRVRVWISLGPDGLDAGTAAPTPTPLVKPKRKLPPSQ